MCSVCWCDSPGDGVGVAVGNTLDDVGNTLDGDTAQTDDEQLTINYTTLQCFWPIGLLN